MSPLSVSRETQHAQDRASDPGRSVFVAANAGSGKTHVLTMRVVRLLLSGVEPGRILCLTYTKAAAAEMQARVFARLSRWTRLSDAELQAELVALGGADEPVTLARARQLFATALETPGGLKIQTIHAFCEAILHQFPLEANVPGHFEVLDDSESALLLAEARRMLIVNARPGTARPEDAGLAEAFADALAHGGEAGLDRLVGECIAARDRIGEFIAVCGGLPDAIDLLQEALGVDPAADPYAGIDTPPGFDAAFRAELADAAARSHASTDAKLVEKLAAFAAARDGEARCAALSAIVFTQKGERCSLRSVATKAVVDRFPDLVERVGALADALEDVADRVATARLFAASRAALTIADRLERDYRDLKQRRGRLDFEDLIVRTAELLLRREASAWVHYKLDRGIDHVLVDEAQDTSRRQWQVVRAMVDEFFQDAEETGRRRTVFAVGDEKQSIYSFQGASPAMFAAERRRLEAMARQSGKPFDHVGLHQSFRSAADILAAVDRIFHQDAHRRGLSSEGQPPVHVSARAQAPGLVELWPTVRPLPVAAEDDWLAPIDHQPQDAPIHRLAARIAQTVRDWVGTPIAARDGVRRLDAGDIIILVRKRSAFVAAMGAALRALGAPDIRVAGADRLTITEHLAVQDLVALGRAVSNAEDELSLAAVLKSPLFGFSDDELMAIALSRTGPQPGPLYRQLRRLAEPDGAALLADTLADRQGLAERIGRAVERFEELRDRAGYLGVYGFYARLLGPEGGRAALAARLGRDTAEVVDAFLDLALASDSDGRRGLDAFLADLAANPPVIRREMTAQPGEVRIMTVHAAKGLEAPVVFLVDPGSEPFSATHAARLMSWDEMPGLPSEAPPGLLWCPDAACRNRVVDGLRAQEKDRAEDEYRRLLYVGLTRAADRLVVCGTAGSRDPGPDTWARHVHEALGPDCTPVHDASGEVIALRFGALAQIEPLGPAAAPAAPQLPRRAIDLTPLPPEEIGPRPLVPSGPGPQSIVDFGGRAWRSPVLEPQEDASHAIRRGQMAHRLLQVLPDLPEAARAAAAARFLSRSAPDWTAADRDALAARILDILAAPHYADLFRPGSRAEVAITGTVTIDTRSVPVNGLIDRLAIDGDRVLLVDYKTSRPVPERLAEVPPAHLRQMALYTALLAPLYPEARIEPALLYTEGPVLMPLPQEALSLNATVEGSRY